MRVQVNIWLWGPGDPGWALNRFLCFSVCLNFRVLLLDTNFEAGLNHAIARLSHAPFAQHLQPRRTAKRGQGLWEMSTSNLHLSATDRCESK